MLNGEEKNTETYKSCHLITITRNSEEFTGGGKSLPPPPSPHTIVRQGVEYRLLLFRIRDSRSSKKQVITKLCKRCPLSTKCPQKQRNKYFNAYLHLSSISRKTQTKEIRLLSSVHFLVTSTTSNRKVKQTFKIALR